MSAQHASSSQQHQVSASQEHRVAGEHGHAPSHKNGKNRRKHRSKRGLQGRPLVHERRHRSSFLPPMSPLNMLPLTMTIIMTGIRRSSVATAMRHITMPMATPGPSISTRRSISAPTIAAC